MIPTPDQDDDDDDEPPPGRPIVREPDSDDSDSDSEDEGPPPLESELRGLRGVDYASSSESEDEDEAIPPLMVSRATFEVDSSSDEESSVGSGDEYPELTFGSEAWGDVEDGEESNGADF
jgi:hypothetical protein